MADDHGSNGEGKTRGDAVAVVTVPRNPTARSVARMLEDLEPLGMHSTDHADLIEGLEGFMHRFVAEIGERIHEHARRYGVGFYQDNDPDDSMQMRINVALMFAIYFTESVERIVNGALAANNTAVSAIAARCLAVVSEALSDGFYDLEIEQVGKRALTVEPVLLAGLNTTGQSEHAIPVKQVYPQVKEVLRSRIYAAMDEMFGPEED